MNWLSFLARRPDEQYLRRIAERAAGECRSKVWQRVSHRTPTMSSVEARGYIQARASILISQAVQEAIDDDDKLTDEHHQPITQIAIEMIVRMIDSQTRLTAIQKTAA